MLWVVQNGMQATLGVVANRSPITIETSGIDQVVVCVVKRRQQPEMRDDCRPAVGLLPAIWLQDRVRRVGRRLTVRVGHLPWLALNAFDGEELFDGEAGRTTGRKEAC